MILYILIPLIIIIFAKQINKKNFTFVDFALIIFMSLICGLRYNVGTDYGFYVKMYDNILFYPRIEILFKYFIECLNALNFEANTFLLISAFITIGLFYYSIKKNSQYPAESLFLFVCLGYYAHCFNTVRQMMATSLIVFSFIFIRKRKFMPYLITVLIAGAIHTSALIMIPFYFISNIQFSKKMIKLIYFITFISIFLYQPLMNFVTTNFVQYSVYSKVNEYTFSEAGAGTYVILIFHLILITAFILKRKELLEKDPNNKYYITLAVFSLFFYFLSINNTVIVRIGYYFSVFIIFILPSFLRINSKKYNSKNILSVIIFFLLYYIIHLISFNEMFPYNSIIFK